MIRECKKSGLKIIKENFGLIISAYLLYMLLSVGVCVISGIDNNAVIKIFLSIVMFVLACIFQLGLVGIFTKKHYGKDAKVKDLFSYFNDFPAWRKNVLINLVVGVILFAISVALFFIFAWDDFASLMAVNIPLTSIDIGWPVGEAAFKMMDILEPYLLGMTISALLFVPMFIFIFKAFISSIVDFGTVIIVRKGKLYDKCISNAFSIGFKNMFKYFIFQLSFIGWIILWVLLFIVGFVSFIAILDGGSVFIAILLSLIAIIYLLLLSIYIKSAEVVYINNVLDDDYGLSEEFSNMRKCDMNEFDDVG